MAGTDNGVSIPDTVTVVGTGGFGAWAAIFAARAGAQKIVLINPTGTSRRGTIEDVQQREVALGPFYLRHIGVAKVDALKEIIDSYELGADVVAHPIRFDAEAHSNLLEGVVFAGVSNEETLRAIWASAAKQNLRCFSGIYNGINFGVLSDLPRGMDIGASESWVGSTAMCALLAVNAAFVQPVNFWGSVSDISAASLPDLVRSKQDL